MNTISKEEKSIVLIGFMGVGKTSVGEIVAKKLNCDFVDIDKEIEMAFGMPIPKIFETLGEETFRKKEKHIITDYSKQKGKIISVGGGAFLQEDIRETCLANCLVIYLDVSWDTWKERLNLLMDSRPVLQGRTMEEIEELFYKRKDTYSQHHIKFDTDNHNVTEVADNMIAYLK